MQVKSEKLYKMALSHFNEPIIVINEIVRLIGYGEDESDCYLICQKMGGEVFWETCVGGYYWLNRLKGQGYVRSTTGEGWDDLTRLDNILSLNGAPKADEFKVVIEAK